MTINPSETFNLETLFSDLSSDGEGNVLYRYGDKDATAEAVVFSWKNGQINKLETVTEFRNSIMSMTDKQRKDLANRINKISGFNVSPDRASGRLEDAAVSIAQYNIESNLANWQNSKTTNKPFRLLTFDQSLKLGSETGGGGPTTQVSYTSFSKEESAAILEGFYTQALGRRPDEEEINKFHKELTAAANKKPTVTTQTVSGTTQTSRTKSGFGQTEAELMAREQAESTRGASGYLMSTKYYDAFIEALESRI